MAKLYTVLFEDGRNTEVGLDQLSEIVEDATSWLNFLTMVRHPRTYAEMAIYPRGKPRMNTRVIRHTERRPTSSFHDPFG